MRFLPLFILLMAGSVFCYPVIEAGFIHDSAGILNPADTSSVSDMISTCEEKCGVKFRLFIINSVSDYTESPQDFEDFCAGLFAQAYENGFSEKAGLMLVAVKDRKAKIELGTPLESKYSADAAKIVREKMVPYFKNGDFSRGIFTGLSAFRALFAPEKKKSDLPFVPVLLILITVTAGTAAYFVFVSKKIKLPVPAAPKNSIDVFGGGAWGKWQ